MSASGPSGPLVLFYQYDFVVGLLQGFMINAHDSGSNSPGAGTFSRDLTKTKSLQCRDFTWALHMEKPIFPPFPGPRGDVVANHDWCIIYFIKINITGPLYTGKTLNREPYNFSFEYTMSMPQ